MKVNTFQLKTCCLGVLLLLFVYKFGDIMTDDERELGIINVLAVLGFAQWVCCDGFGLGLLGTELRTIRSPASGIVLRVLH